MSVGVVPKTTIYVVKSKYMFRKIGFCISNNHILGNEVMPKCKLLFVILIKTANYKSNCDYNFEI